MNLRIGVVLAHDGGALKPMLLPFRLGLGGRIGSGKQFWSWIAFDDVIGVALFALHCDTLRGPVKTGHNRASSQCGVCARAGRGTPPSHDLPVASLDCADTSWRDGRGVAVDLNSRRTRKVKAAGYSFAHPELRDAIHAAVRGK